MWILRRILRIKIEKVSKQEVLKRAGVEKEMKHVVMRKDTYLGQEKNMKFQN